jgi:hypothetical protein
MIKSLTRASDNRTTSTLPIVDKTFGPRSEPGSAEPARGNGGSKVAVRQCCHRRGADVPGLLVLILLVALITLVCLVCLGVRATVHFLMARLRSTS